jgi:hypothetical protein
MDLPGEPVNALAIGRAFSYYAHDVPKACVNLPGEPVNGLAPGRAFGCDTEDVGESWASGLV